MPDPPALSYADGSQDTVDTNTVNTSTIVDNSEIVCTPTGSVEVSTQSFEPSTSDEENRNDVEKGESPPSRRDMVRYRRSKTVDTEGQAGEPLISNDDDNRKSPILQLPLPPSSDGMRKRTSFGSANSTPSKATVLARKAERYSSLKKRKGPNGLLNRLFCSTPPGAEGTGSFESDLESKRRAPSPRRSPRSAKRESVPSDDEGDCGDCLKLVSGAKESVTLHDAEKVRCTIQDTISELGCGPSTLPSPAVVNKKYGKLDSCASCDESLCFSLPEVRIVGDAAIGSSGRKQKGAAHRGKPHPTDDDSIAAPKTKLSMSCTDDIASPSKKIQPKKSKSKRKRVKTPGGLVIPSPFTHSGTGVFPNTSDNYHARASLHKSPPRPNNKGTRKSSSPKSSSKRNKDRSPMGMSLTMSTVSTADTSQTSGSGKTTEDTPIPLEMIQIQSNDEDLSPVPEVSVSKEKSGEDDQPNTSAGSQDSLRDSDKELARVQDELRDELLETDKDAVAVQGSKLISQTQEATKSDDSSLKTTNEGQVVSELQEQVELANRLARMRLQEIERLEKTMDAMRERQVEDSDLQRMKERLDTIQQDKVNAVEQAKREMQLLMEQKLEAMKTGNAVAANQSPAETKQEEKKEEDVDEQFLTTSSSKTSGEPSPEGDGKSVHARIPKKQEDETDLEGKSSSGSDIMIMKSSKDEGVELMRVRREDKKQDVHSTPSIDSVNTKSTTVDGITSSISKGRQKGQLVDQEKESLRSQILLLEEQASVVVAEHERALSELRRSSETEIERVMAEMEARMQKQIDKERELKESLSAANSREKEDLLEKIDLLQSEKTTDRSVGLREVQRKEDLVRKIEAMEQKEKEQVDLHQQALNDLRNKNELELRKLRDQIDALAASQSESFDDDDAKQRAVDLKKENHVLYTRLEATVAEMNAALQQERSKNSQAKEAIATLENQVEAKTKEHCRELEETENALKSEISKLKGDLEARCAVEEAMQITSNENEMLKEQIERAKEESRSALDKLQHEHEEKFLEIQQEHAQKLDAAADAGVRRLVEAEASHKTQLEEIETKKIQEVENAIEEHRKAEQDLATKLSEIEKDYELRQTKLNEKLVLASKGSSARVTALEEELQNKEKMLSQLQADKEAIEATSKLELAEALALVSDKNKKFQEVTDVHNKQFEDLLSQLDLVEAEHKGVLAGKEKDLSEKDVFISGLRVQLQEAQNKVQELQRNLVIEEERSFQLQRTCSELEVQLKSAKSELLEMSESHDAFIKKAAIAQEKACEDAREEMIEKAEIQFQQANEHYIALRKQYDESQRKLEKCEGDIRQAKNRAERILKEKESREVDLKAEMAALKATIAKTESDTAQQWKKFRRELDEACQSSRDFESKAAQEEMNNRKLEDRVSRVEALNAKLQQEYDEMKAVSEELMAIVEGHEPS